MKLRQRDNAARRSHPPSLLPIPVLSPLGIVAVNNRTDFTLLLGWNPPLEEYFIDG